MKIETSIGSVETKRKTKEEKFDIHDQQLFINMYRNTIYKNKIRVIPQEYMCNARDAHREVGKDDVPIEVTLPTVMDPMLKIRDFGPGINDDRMSIFRSYGASTKRDSNDETGGFGIGCKCAWSYTEQFTVDTVFDDEDGRYRKIYSVYIKDSSDPGSVRLVSERKVDEDEFPTGTTIKVPVMDNDIDNFVESVRTVGTYWDVKPIIVGHDDFEWHNIDATTEQDNWKLCGHSKLYSIRRQSYVVIDGIPYNVDFDLLVQGKSGYEDVGETIKEVKHELDDSIARFYQGSGVVFFFDTGELKISPNREDLDYGCIENIKKLVEVLTKSRDDIVDIFKKKVIKNDKMTLMEILQEANKYDLFNIEVLWTDPLTEKEIDITELLRLVSNSDCYYFSKDDNDKMYSFPLDKIDDKTAVYYYGNETTAYNAYERLTDYPEILNDINAEKVVILYGKNNGRYYRQDKYDYLVRRLANRELGTIKKPKNKISKIANKATGIFKANHHTLLDSEQLLTEEIDDIDFKKALFIKRKGRSHYMFYGTDKERLFTNSLFRIVGDKEVYVLNRNGENALKKAGIKINWIENHNVANKVAKYFKKRSVQAHSFNSDWNIDRMLPFKSHIYWFLRNNKEAQKAWDTYVKMAKVKVQYSVYNDYQTLANIYGVKIPEVDYRSVIKILEENLPFIGLINHIESDHKKIMINIIRSYKEYDDGKKQAN